MNTKRKKLLTIENAKTTKGESLGYLTGILYMAPADESGVMNMCPNASKGCRESCLYTAGRGRFDSVKNARIAKTFFFVNERKEFYRNLILDIESLIRKAKREKLKPCVRLNGTSDVVWEKLYIDQKLNTIFDLFPDVQFYDYTKIPTRFRDSWTIPKNYSLTFSKSEINQAEVKRISDAGHNVAVVFSGVLPDNYLGKQVINADDHDLRFLDKQNVICGLKAKGDAKKDKSGFVVKSGPIKLTFVKGGKRQFANHHLEG